MVDLEDSLTPVLDEDTVSVSASGQFDSDNQDVKIRWRGVKQAQGGACCYTDPDTFETICDDTLSVAECADLAGDFIRGASCADDPCTGACCEDDGMGGTLCEDLSQDDCDAAGGDFKGIDTACSDDPDPCVTGACCHSGDCTVESSDSCTELMGTYQGDGTSCTDIVCGCMDASACNYNSDATVDDGSCILITLDCDQICFTSKKCGWPGFFNSGLCSDTFYRDADAYTTQIYNHRNVLGNGAECNAFADSFTEGNFPFTDGGSFCDPSDATQTACSGTSTCHCYDTVCHSTCHSGSDCGASEYCSAGVCCEDAVLVGTETCTWCFDPVICDNSSCESAFVNPTYAFRGGIASSDTEAFYDGGEITETTILSAEITTADLLTHIRDSLPSYDSDFNDGCEAKLIDQNYGDCSNFIICRFKPRFSFGTALTVGITITYNEHFEPQPDIGMGSPSDTPKTIMASMGDTEVTGDEVMEPTNIGTITITDIVCTLS